ncbi:HAD-IA family hydrolase [Streptomyces antimycoticus]|uniref:Hydrolase n=1 Tax=Streptomyces antimycoticus TaxID=68175 RepID=A0A4D4JUJ4_9ACTN|nr:hydrolase [Streptomyces antimycoticus]
MSEFGEEGVHGVLFDFAGTLFDDTGVLTAPRLVAKASGRGITLDEQVAARLIRRTLAYVDAPERSAAKEGCDLSPDAHKRIWTGLIADAGPFEPPLVEALYDCLTDNDAWLPYPDTLPVLDALSAAGVRTGVLSNIGWDIRPIFKRIGVLDQLYAVVLSCEVGLAKPDPAIFGVACERLSVSAGRVLFVGDDPVKDGAAARAGLPVYLLPSERDVRVPRGLSAILPLAGAENGHEAVAQ